MVSSQPGSSETSTTSSGGLCQGPKDHTDLLRCKRQTHTVNDGSRGCRGVALESRTHVDLLERLSPTFDLRGTLVHTESRSVALSAKYLDPLRSGGREAQRIEGDEVGGSQFQSDHTEADGRETAISNLTKTGISRRLYILV